MNFNTAAYHTPISHNTLWHSDFLGSHRRNCPPRCTITFQIVPPLSCISGKTALPASVIRPNRSILRQRFLFNSDHKLFFLRGPIFVPLFRFPSSSWCCRSSQSPSLLRLHRCTRKFRCPPGVRTLQSPSIRPLCYDFPKAIVVTHLDCALAANSYIPLFHPHNVRFADLFALIVSQNAAEHKNRNRGLNCGSCSWSYGCSAGIEWFRTSPDCSVCGQAASRPCSTRKFRATSFTSRPSTSTW